MNKLREGSTSSIPPPPVPLLLPSSSCSNASLAMSSSQTRGVSSVVSLDTHPSSTNNMTKSRSTHNLILPTTAIATFTSQHSKLPSSRRGRAPLIPRRPPHLPTATTIQSSSSSSSNTSSPTKPKQHLPPSLQESILPLHELDNSTNDLMPKWAKDCFYRTVVLGLKPLLLQDIPSSPIKHSASTSSIESSDSLEISSEVLNNQKPVKMRRSSSIPDYKQLETNKTVQKYTKKK